MPGKPVTVTRGDTVDRVLLLRHELLQAGRPSFPVSRPGRDKPVPYPTPNALEVKSLTEDVARAAVEMAARGDNVKAAVEQLPRLRELAAQLTKGRPDDELVTLTPFPTGLRAAIERTTKWWLLCLHIAKQVDGKTAKVTSAEKRQAFKQGAEEGAKNLTKWGGDLFSGGLALVAALAALLIISRR